MSVPVDGDAYTWRLDAAGALEIVTGDIGEGPRADLSPDRFSDLVNGAQSP